MPGYWHNKMESRFPKDMREVKFFCANNNSKTSRRADIMLDNKRTLEIQHSRITETEIINRFNDWNKFGKDIIWVIDGNTPDVKCEKLTNDNYLVIFNESWKYKSFEKTYNNCLLEINGNVFNIEIKNVKCKMILLSHPIPLNKVINCLINKPDKIWNLWDTTNIIKPTLKIYQQGAGNGKTYGIWKSICHNQDKQTYIIVTKQHSAKNVIYEELIDQKNRKEYHIENLTHMIEENLHQHYCIKYIHKKTHKECIVLIGTIDSYCYNLSSSDKNSHNFFQGVLDSIRKYGPTKISKYGHMNFAGQQIFINRQCEIWIDEVQDLSISYLYAFTRLMLETGCNINIVGDKLQTLEYSQNFLTEIKNEKLPNIEISIEIEKNVNRRIKVKNMYQKINKIINFKKYELLPITIENEENLLETHTDPIEIIPSPIIYADDTDENKITQFVDRLIEKVDLEVNAHFYTPNCFMFIFPIMKSNVLAVQLETGIQEYWLNKFNDTNYISKIKDTYWKKHTPTKYTQYVHLHKHTEGTVINTKDSVNTTRIMSIRTSKGDGREVVFILGTTEKSLKRVSNNEINLLYESHLHVAFTRGKNKIYFGLQKNNDNIHSRFSEIQSVEYLPSITSSINLSKLVEYIDKKNIKNILIDNNVIVDNYINDISNNMITVKETVDWGYHCIKYATYLHKVIFNILENSGMSEDFKETQLYVILHKISKLKITRKSTKNYWDYLREKQYKKGHLQMDEMPICVLNKQHNWIKYIKIIENTMCKIQKNIKNNKLTDMNIYESIVLIFMIDIFCNQTYGIIITPMELYNITHFFHSDDTKEKKLLMSLNNINRMINSIMEKYKDMKWNIFKHIQLKSKKDITVKKIQYPVIGFNKEKVCHIMLKSSINKLNFWDIMIECFMERFLIFNCSDKDKDKYNDKKIETLIFILDESQIIEIDWDWDKELYNNVLEETKKSIKKYYENYHYDIYNYLNQIKSLDNKGKYWGKNTKCKTPFDYICTKIDRHPCYINNLFKDFHNEWLNGDKETVKEYYKTYENFNEQLINKLDDILKINFSEIVTEDIDDDF